MAFSINNPNIFSQLSSASAAKPNSPALNPASGVKAPPELLKTQGPVDTFTPSNNFLTQTKNAPFNPQFKDPGTPDRIAKSMNAFSEAFPPGGPANVFGALMESANPTQDSGIALI